MLNAIINMGIASIFDPFSRIKCPALVMAGDRDQYIDVNSVVRCASAIQGSQLSIIPGCGHVVFFCNFNAVWSSIAPFIGMN